MVVFVSHLVFFKYFLSLNSFIINEKLKEIARMYGVKSFKINDVLQTKLISNYFFF